MTERPTCPKCGSFGSSGCLDTACPVEAAAVTARKAGVDVAGNKLGSGA